MSKTNNDEIKVLISKAELVSFAQSMIFTFSECMLKYGNSNTEIDRGILYI